MEQFSLFELEKIPIEELWKVYWKVTGKDEYEIRAKIALILKDEGKLKDCPLFSEYEEDVKVFYDLLSRPTNIQPSSRLMGRSDDFTLLVKNHRILFVYILYSLSIIDRDVIISHPIHYDESYFEEIDKFNITSLVYIDIQYNSAIYAIHHMRQKLAEKIYKLKDPLDKLIGTINYKHNPRLAAYLNQIGVTKNDNNLKDKIEIAMENYSIHFPPRAAGDEPILSREGAKFYYYMSFFLSPRVEYALKYMEYEHILYSDLSMNFVFIAISSVMGTNPCSPKISYDTYIEIMRFLQSKHGDCNTFFKDPGEKIKNEQGIRYLMAAMVAICPINSIISSLTPIVRNITYIPPDKYI